MILRTLKVPEMRLCWPEGCPTVGSRVVFRSVPFAVRLVLARVGLLLASGDRRAAEILALKVTNMHRSWSGGSGSDY